MHTHKRATPNRSVVSADRTPVGGQINRLFSRALVIRLNAFEWSADGPIVKVRWRGKMGRSEESAATLAIERAVVDVVAVVAVVAALPSTQQSIDDQ